MVVKLENVKIGSDPEAFLIDKNGEPVSSIGLVKGDKRKPYNIGNNCGIQTDNVLVEFTFPAVKLDESNRMFDYIEYCKDYINLYLIKNEISVRFQSSANLDEKYLQDPKALEAGCDPDFNVWSKSTNFPAEYDKTTMRAAGFHIHIGYNNPSEEVSEEIVKAFDLFLVVPSLLIDKDTERRKLYGKAGCFRFKDYGVECRSLGSFIGQDRETIEWLFKSLNNMIKFLNDGNSAEGERKNIIEAIDNNNTEIARMLIEKYNLEINTKKENVCAD